MFLLPIQYSWCFLPLCRIYLIFTCAHHYYWCMSRWCPPSQLYIRASRNILLYPTLINSHFLQFLVRLVLADVHRLLSSAHFFKSGYLFSPLRFFSFYQLFDDAGYLGEYIFSEVAAMAIFSNASEISSWIVVAMLDPWKSAWVALMFCSLRRSW